MTSDPNNSKGNDVDEVTEISGKTSHVCCESPRPYTCGLRLQSDSLSETTIRVIDLSVLQFYCQLLIFVTNYEPCFT